MLSVEISGVVTPFKGNGRKLGYPTANLTTATDLKDGVYFGYADMKGYVRQPAMIFVGTPETMGDTERRVEAYLLDVPDIDYYGERLKLDARHYHRANKKFESVDALKAMIADDERVAKDWFDRNSAL